MNDERLIATAKAIYDTNPRMQLLWFNRKERTTGYLDEPRKIGWDELDDAEHKWFTDQATAALAAADQFSIDAALDAVHPSAAIVAVFMENDGTFTASIQRPTNMKDGRVWLAAETISGTGPARTAAILAACKAAKEAHDGE